jgi:hypothetical protein
VSSPPANSSAAVVQPAAAAAAAAAAGSAFMSPAVSLSGGLAPVRTHPAVAAASTPSPIASLGAWGQQQQQQQQGIGTPLSAAHTPGRAAGSSSSNLQARTPTAAASNAASAGTGDLISLDSLNLDSQPEQGQAVGLQDRQLLQAPESSGASVAGMAEAGIALSQYNPFAAASAAGGSPGR